MLPVAVLSVLPRGIAVVRWCGGAALGHCLLEARGVFRMILSGRTTLKPQEHRL